ncbi:MAG: PDZ domain-containing protein, partial [Ktedonobacteraceae bacterium]|nr:PDZ domain-containing protein [Ktedonobacteraceae bacterium]
AYLRQRLQPERAGGLLILGFLPEREGRYNDLLLGDILLDVAGQPVSSGEELRALLARHEAGEHVQVRLARGGEIINLTVTTVSAPQA